MSSISVGTHDRGMFDSEDKLLVKNKLKEKLTFQEAENFAKNQHAGSELVTEEKDGTFSVYDLGTDPESKAITGKDFTDGTADLNTNVKDKFSASSAFIFTSDNVIRSLSIDGIDGIQVDHINQNLLKTNLSFSLEDVNGIETNTKNDMLGTVSGSVQIDKKALEFAVKKADKEIPQIGLSFEVDKENKSYNISVNKGALGTMARVNLTPDGNGLKVKIDTAGVVGALPYVLLGPIGGAVAENQLESLAIRTIVDQISQNTGLKVDQIGSDTFRLVPALEKNDMLSSFSFKDMNFKIEDFKPDLTKTNFKMEDNGNLSMSFQDAKITASSDTKSKVGTVADKEGSDKISVNIQGDYNNIVSTTNIETDIGLNIQKDEATAASARIKTLTGQDVNVSGSLNIDDIKVDSQIKTQAPIMDLIATNNVGQLVRKENISDLNASIGKIGLNNLNMNYGDYKLNISKAEVKGTSSGNLELLTQPEKDSPKVAIKADGVNAKGSFQDKASKINFNGNLNGTIEFDKNNPSNIAFKTDKTKDTNIALSVSDISGKNKLFSLGNLDARGATVEVDNTNGKLAVSSDPNNSIKVSKFTSGDISISNASIRGSMNMDTKSGNLTVNAKSVNLSAKLGDVKISNLSGAGKITYKPNEGITLDNINAKASGKIGDMDISKIKTKGSIAFDLQGNIKVGEASNIAISSNLGDLGIKGDLKIGSQNGVFNFSNDNTKPIVINLAPKVNNQSVKVKDLSVEGKLSFDANNGNFGFNEGANGLKINSGTIGQVEVKDLSVKGQINYNRNNEITISNPNAQTEVSGTIGGFTIDKMTSNAPIKIDANKQTIAWNGDMSVDLKDIGLKLDATGDMSIVQNAKGQFEISSKNGTIKSLDFGVVNIKDMQIDGKVIYDPNKRTLDIEGLNNSSNVKIKGGSLSFDNNSTSIKELDLAGKATYSFANNELAFNGTETNPLKLKGSLNDKPIDITTTGGLKFAQKNSDFEIMGDNVHIDGMIDGFEIKSTSDATGKVVISQDGEVTESSSLKYNFDVDGVSIYNNKAQFKPTDDGYKMNLSGSLAMNNEKLNKFLGKVAGKVDKDASAGINQVTSSLNSYFSSINVNKASFENLEIDFDKNMAVRSFKANTNSELTDVKTKVALSPDTKEQAEITFSKVNLVADTESKSDGGIKINQGQISFELDDKLRDDMKAIVTKNLEKSGLKDVDLEITKKGEAILHNAKYVHKGFLGKNSAIGVKIEFATNFNNNKLDIQVKKVAVANLIDVKNNKRLQQEIEKSLDSFIGETEKTNSKKGSIFSVDLKSVFAKQLGKDFNLNNMSIDDNGKALVDFSYNTGK